jgi:ketosteroid isomerase-like protein
MMTDPEGMQDRVRFESTYEIAEIRVAGAPAYARTHLTVTATPRDGSAPTRRRGWTLTIFEKQQGGSWVVIRDANLLTVD